jgi:hypothetical protein
MNKADIEKLDANEKIIRIMNVGWNIVLAGLCICGVGFMISSAIRVGEAKNDQEFLLNAIIFVLGSAAAIPSGIHLEHEFSRWQRSRPWGPLT